LEKISGENFNKIYLQITILRITQTIKSKAGISSFPFTEHSYQESLSEKHELLERASFFSGLALHLLKN
jgi:hypothetical protein